MQSAKLFSIVLLVSCVASGLCAKLQEKFRWKEVSYAWPSESAKEDAIKSGQYKSENNLPLGLDVWQNKIFITVPRSVCTNIVNRKYAGFCWRNYARIDFRLFERAFSFVRIFVTY